MFIGRGNEISQLKSILNRNRKSTALIYGKRRIGKSFLITEVMKSFSCKVIYYECLNASAEENLLGFESRIRSAFGQRFLHFESFEEAFQFLSSAGERVIVILDEYSCLKTSREKYYIDSLFQRIIDRMGDNIRLVLIGSFVSVMRELLEEENPLFGRFSLVMHLHALDYYDSAQFYSGKTVREKAEFYGIFGGNPFVNSEIDPDADLKTNIIRLILNPNSAVRSYLENILLSELSKTAPANMILSALSNGKKKYSEISSRIRSEVPGTLDKQLKNLILMDILQKKNPINRPDDRKKIFYEISDNLTRFYYAYIFSNRDVIRTIGEQAFYDLMILPTIDTFLSYRFEETAREYFQRLVRNGSLSGVYDIGTYWYDDPSEKKNGEFDCVLKHQSSYSFYEVKTYNEPLRESLCEAEEREVRNLAKPLDIEKIGFISISGFDFSSDRYDLIPAEQMYEQE